MGAINDCKGGSEILSKLQNNYSFNAWCVTFLLPPSFKGLIQLELYHGYRIDETIFILL